jgi:hypothetical protein
MSPLERRFRKWAPMLTPWVFTGLIAGCASKQPSAGNSPSPSNELAPAAGRAENEGVIEPEADAALRRMSAYLDGLKSFRVDSMTTDELVTTEGQKIQFVKDTKLAIRRPDRLSAERMGPAGHTVLRYDGRQLAIHNPDLGLYAIAPAPAELKSTIDFAQDKLGIDAPAGDLLLPNSYDELIDGVLVGRYIGREPIEGVHAHHLAMSESEVDWQIWIKDGPDPVPIRYVITTKDLPAKPQFTAELRNWRADPSLSDDQFAFAPPSDAKRMEFDELKKMKLKREQAQ